MSRWLALALLVLSGCNHASGSADQSIAADLSSAGDGGERICRGTTLDAPSLNCGPYACPHKAWCDRSGAAPVCRCGESVPSALGSDCHCDGDDPAHPGCGAGPSAGCP